MKYKYKEHGFVTGFTVWLGVQAMYFMKYFPTAALTKSYFSVLIRTSWKCLATRCITYNIFSFWSHSQAKGRYVSRCPNSYTVICSLKLSFREWRVRAGVFVTLHKYIKATSLLSNGWAASSRIQHGDQLCGTSFIFTTAYVENTLSTKQLKLFGCWRGTLHQGL